MAINLSGMFQNLGGATDMLAASVKGPALPDDPMQRNAMQRAGVTNPMLQMMGQGFGAAMGKNMGSPMDAVKKAMSSIQPGDPQAVLKIAAAIKDVDPVKAAQLIAEYKAATAKAGQEEYSFSGNERFKDAKGNYYWASQVRSKSSNTPQMVVMDINGQAVDPKTIEGLQRVDADGLTAAERAEIERSKGFAEYDAKFYSGLQDSISASAAQDVNLKQLDELLANPEFEMSRLDQLAPDFLASDNMLVFRQLRNSLGLDVIGSTTFGALSEAELNIALATALPPIKDKNELRKWVQEKRRLEKVLRNEMSYAAQLLRQGKPADEVRRVMEERRSENTRMEKGSEVQLKPVTYTKQQWETTKRNRNMTDQELREFLRTNHQIDARVGG